MQLFTFIRADLASFRSEDPTAGLLVNDANQHPAYPKSMLLINPLFSNYQLNSVNIAAQDSIPVPEILDLDAWIVPPPKEFSTADAATANDTQQGERPLTKKKVKGKGKEKGKGKDSKVLTTKPLGTQPDHSPSPGPSETEEEKIEREKASDCIKFALQGGSLSSSAKSAKASKNGVSST
jgi:AP-3 complex subunit delta